MELLWRYYQPMEDDPAMWHIKHFNGDEEDLGKMSFSRRGNILIQIHVCWKEMRQKKLVVDGKKAVIHTLGNMLFVFT